MHGCPRTTAEVVTETPLVGKADDGVFYLPKYGNELYSSVSITDNDGYTGTLSDSNCPWPGSSSEQEHRRGEAEHVVALLGRRLAQHHLGTRIANSR